MNAASSTTRIFAMVVWPPNAAAASEDRDACHALDEESAGRPLELNRPAGLAAQIAAMQAQAVLAQRCLQRLRIALPDFHRGGHHGEHGRPAGGLHLGSPNVA